MLNARNNLSELYMFVYLGCRLASLSLMMIVQLSRDKVVAEARAIGVVSGIKA